MIIIIIPHLFADLLLHRGGPGREGVGGGQQYICEYLARSTLAVHIAEDALFKPASSLSFTVDDLHHDV